MSKLTRKTTTEINEGIVLSPLKDGSDPFFEGSDKPAAITIDAVRVTNAGEFPIDIDIGSEYQNIFAAGILRGSEHAHIYNHLCTILFSNRGFKMGTLLFWSVFCLKFQPNTDVLPQLRKRISKLYTKIFSAMPSPKEDLANIFIFILAYTVQMIFSNVFVTNRNLFSMRFILDCYHIVIFELHGIYVSDFYIQNSIEKIFGSKFFFYEQKQEKLKKKAQTATKDPKDEPLTRDLKFNTQNLFFVDGGVEFAAELSNKLRDKPHRSQYHNATTNSNSPYMERSKNSSPTRPYVPTGDNFSSSLIKRPQLAAEASVPKQRTYGTNMTEEGMTLATTNHTEESKIDDNKVYFPKIRFDCSQISPTVSRFLDNSSMTLPFQKKKLIPHSNNKHLTAIKRYDINSSIGNLLVNNPTKSEKNMKVNVLSDYQLKNRPEDYYLGYLPRKLKDRFKDELDLKYILDNTGTYSLKAVKLDPEEKEREKEKKLMQKALSMQQDLMSKPEFSAEFIAKNLQSVEPDSNKIDLAIKRLPTIESPHAYLVDHTASSPMFHVRRQDTIDPRPSALNVKPSISWDSPVRIARDNTIEYDDMSSPLHATIHTATNTNLNSSSNAIDAQSSLAKRLGKNAKKNPLFPLLRGSASSMNYDLGNKDDYVHSSQPNIKMSLDVEEKSRKEKKKIAASENAALTEAKKNAETFIYEDNRKHYFETHSKFINRSVDANISELITKLMQKKNVLSKNVGKAQLGAIRPRNK